MNARLRRVAAAFVQAPPRLGAPGGISIAGITGVEQGLRWDAVATATAPELRGEEVHFLALPDGTLVVDEDVPDGAAAPLAEAVADDLEPPYAAAGVRQDDDLWAVGAVAIRVAELPGATGDAIEASQLDGVRTVLIDGEPAALPAALEDVAAAAGADWSLRAERVDDTLWIVDVNPL